MEVHHHPDLHHNKKNFREYFLEFLMIFLAVTMGFFAETIREKVADGHREKEYIAGLISNAQSDIADLKGLIVRNDELLNGIDSLMMIPKGKFADLAVQDSLYYYSLQYTFSLHLFRFNDLTLVQLRNAGGYRLIRTEGVADSIALYEYKNNDIKVQEEFYVDNARQAWSDFKQVFDGTLTSGFFKAYARNSVIPSKVSVLISTDKAKTDLLLNDYWILSGTVKSYNDRLKVHLEYLARFVSFLKQRYDID